MKEQLWWWLFPDYSLLPKADALIESGNVTTNTVRFYHDTLTQLAYVHASRAQAVERLTRSRANLDVRYPSLSSPADSRWEVERGVGTIRVHLRKRRDKGGKSENKEAENHE